MTTFHELAASRYSVRDYSSKEVEPQILEQILETGNIAPTACNNQPQRIKVLTAPEDLEKVNQCTSCRFGAPVVLLICYDRDVCWTRRFDHALSGEVDASIVTTHMMLEAHALGLGTCWVMYFDAAKTTELFELPANIVPVAVLPIGYPAGNAKPALQHNKRVPLGKILL